MAYDEALTETFRTVLAQSLGKDLPGIVERRMMGGVCFMLNGNMLGGAHREKDGTGFFMFRVGKENARAAEKIGGGEIVDMGGRKMGGLYFVEADSCSTDLLNAWSALALSFASSLPRK